MFSFFSKKKFLVDLLDGFVDIHNHILPGIDDGAKTTGESISLIKGFSEFGVKSFVCTPHIMHNYFDNTPETIKSSFKKLKTQLEAEGFTGVTIDYAAEHMVDDNFGRLLVNGEVLPISGGYLLVEMSFLQPPIHFFDSMEKVVSKGYFPILAHPERYRFLNSDLKKYRPYKEHKLLFQVNLLSLAGYYGQGIKKTALRLIDDNQVDFLGSDVHSLKQLNYLKECEVNRAVEASIMPLVERNQGAFSP